MAEASFPQPMECMVDAAAVRARGEDGYGWLTFIEPGRGNRTSLPVSTGPTRNVDVKGARPMPVWHIDFPDDGSAVTSPSVHVPGEYHSPARCRWRIVDELADVSEGS